MKAKPIKAIIWDLDGTLIDFKINSIKARRKAIKVLRKYGISRENLSVKMPLLEIVKISRESFIKLGISDEEIKEIIKKVNNAVILVEHEAAIKATLTDGIIIVLEFAKKTHLKQAVFTYNTHRNARISLETARINHYFELVAGRDDVKNLKPHPDHLNYICERLDVNLDEIVVIGDMGRDIEAALNTQSRSIALNTRIPNFIKRETFKEADKIIELNEIPNELIKTLEEFLS
ncbi:MAG: HAD family hydrolase [Candidatus Lokiarchaeota archaeon]|nr:HAD family hydrolase [Candidatus Lokiarchaeota archaeon]